MKEDAVSLELLHPEDFGCFFVSKILNPDLYERGIGMESKIKKITVIGMMCALAYLAVLLCRIPITSTEFLKYEPKDIIIAMGGIIFGPLTSVFISVIVSVIEMFSISQNGFWGLFMNILASLGFCCTIAVVYKKNQNFKGIVFGAILGVLVMTGLMVFWNYLVTPIYTGMDRKQIVPLLIPVFMVFNLIKGTINAIITIILYKPVTERVKRIIFY